MDPSSNETTADTAAFFDLCLEAISKAIKGDTTGWVDFGELTLVPAVKALLILVTCYFLAKLLSRSVAKTITAKFDATLGRFVEKLVYRGTIGCAFIFVLSYFGVRSTSFAAVLAAMSFAIGLAFQGTLSNFASGILLMVFRPFKVSDLVVLSGITGKVNEIDLFTTAIDTPDNRRLIIPNSAIAGHTIENITFHAERRIDLTFSVGWSFDIEKTRDALKSAILAISELIIENDVRKSQTILVGIGPMTVEWQVRVWTPTSNFLDVRDALICSIKTSMSAAGISVAAPRYTLQFDETFEGSDPSNSPNRVAPRRTSMTFKDAA